MDNKYFLHATGTAISTNRELVDYVTQRFATKNHVWQQRNDKLVDMSGKLDFLINIYADSQGFAPRSTKSKALYYKSALAHQAWNTLMSVKMEPDFIDFAPLMGNNDPELMLQANTLTDAHRILRYKGGYDRAKLDSKKDLIWGNSFVQLGTSYDENDNPEYVEYTRAPFDEMRGYYGDTDIMRVIDYPVTMYAGIYGEEMLTKVAPGGLLTNKEENKQEGSPEREYRLEKDTIQVVFYYDPFRKIFAEIHGSNGYIYQNLEGDDYPFIWKHNEGFAPFKESRFYEPTANSYFGWGVMDYLIDMANLETTITNATAFDAIWDASKPSFVFSNDPDDMEQKLDRWARDRARGVNRPIVQKNAGSGTSGQIQSLQKGVDNNNMEVWDKTTISRATRFSNIDFQALSEYAPTAEQQKLKKLESDKLNIRVLLLNEQREKEFAIQEMAFLQNGNTKFHNYMMEVVDQAAKDNKTPEGYIPAEKKKIKDVLKGVKDIEMKIAPRMEGALDDMSFLEIQTMQEDLALLAPGTQAYDIALEKYFAKKNPELELTREDFSAPAQQPPAPEMGGMEAAMGGAPASPAGPAGPADALTAQL